MPRCGHRCFIFVRKLVHRLRRETLAVCFLGVERSHRRSRPAEDRIQFRNRCTIIRSAGGRYLSAPVRGMMQQAGGNTGFLESVSKRFLGEWLSGLSDDEGEIADRTRIERPPQDGQDRQRDRDHPLAFFSSQRRNTIAHMLQTYVVRATASRRMSRLYVATGLCSASVYAYAGPRWRGGWVHRGHFRGRW